MVINLNILSIIQLLHSKMIQVYHKATLFGHQNPIYTLVCSQKPGILFSAGNDKGIVEWDLINEKFLKVLFPITTSVYALHAPKTAPILVAGERNGDVTIFDFEQQTITQTIKQHTSPIFDIKSLSTNELLIGSADGTVSVWSLQYPYPLLRQFTISSKNIRVMAINPAENLIAFGCKDNLIYVYNLSDYSLIKTLSGHSLPITSLQFSPDGGFLLSGSRDATLKIWDTTNFTLQKSINAHFFAVYDIVYHPNGKCFATASRDKSIKLWDAHNFNLKKAISIEKGYQGHQLSVNKLSWDPLTQNLISAGDDRQIIIWNIQA